MVAACFHLRRRPPPELRLDVELAPLSIGSFSGAASCECDQAQAYSGLGIAAIGAKSAVEGADLISGQYGFAFADRNFQQAAKSRNRVGIDQSADNRILENSR